MLSVPEKRRSTLADVFEYATRPPVQGIERWWPAVLMDHTVHRCAGERSCCWHFSLDFFVRGACVALTAMLEAASYCKAATSLSPFARFLAALPEECRTPEGFEKCRCVPLEIKTLVRKKKKRGGYFDLAPGDFITVTDFRAVQA